ncbi:MAG: DUF2235 domain-containing protein [Pikeienuella sp.]
MPKNIVILLDGTSNEISKNRSNILRLYGALDKSDDQLVYYDPGVGTFATQGTWSSISRKVSEVWGMATGFGIDANVKEAYRFLVQNYNRGPEGERDKIYIFGFSRGAYSARVLAGFIHAFGLMDVRNLNLLDYVYRAYKRIGEEEPDHAFAEIRMHERMLDPDRPPIRLLGLFDTVASVIESSGFGIRLRKHAFTNNNASVESVRQALAVAELRTMFRPKRWPLGQTYHAKRFNDDAPKPQEAKEVWFSGVHGDVGGGYPEEEAGLAKIPLHWMIEETKSHGLNYRQTSVDKLVLGQHEDYEKMDPNANAHKSLKGGWWALEFLPRFKPKNSQRPSLFGLIIPFAEKRHIPNGACIHSSVLKRSPLPPNLPKDYTTEP